MRFGLITVCLLRQGLEQAVELHRALFLPVQLQQAIEQIVLLVITQETVGQAQVQRVATVDMGAGEAQEQAELARQAGQEPTGPHIRVQANADLGHGQTTAWRNDTHGGALQQAHAAAQYITVAPADQRLRVGVQAVVKTIFGGKKLRGQGRNFARLFTASLSQAAHFATGAKGFGAVAAQQHADDLRVFGPGLHALIQGQNHRQGEGVKGLWRVQAGDTDASAATAGQFFEMQVHRDLNREGEG